MTVSHVRLKCDSCETFRAWIGADVATPAEARAWAWRHGWTATPLHDRCPECSERVAAVDPPAAAS